MSKCLLILEPSGQRILVDKKTSYLEAVRESGLHIPSECGGNGTCGKCKVLINPTPDSTEVDQKHLSEGEIQKGIRLAYFLSDDINEKELAMYENVVGGVDEPHDIKAFLSKIKELIG